MSHVMGLDSGGTKTILAVAERNGQVVFIRRASGLDPTLDTNWKSGLQALIASRGTDIGQIRSAVFGLPYHGEIASISEAQISAAQEFIPDKSLVVNDVRVAFDGAFAGRPGVLLLAGTGSMAWASRNAPGAPHFRVGGWGDAFGDEGSAFWIGREALSVVSRDLDGRVPSPDFSQAVLAALGLKGSELIGWCYGLENRRAGIAGIAKSVSMLASDGCVDALVILNRAGDHLAAHATTAWRGAKIQGPLRWSHAGGVFSDRTVLKRASEALGCAPDSPRLPPIGGAILLAATRAGWAPDAAWIERLAASLIQIL